MNMKTWPLIRHVRYYYHSYRLARWERAWLARGYAPQQSDRDALEEIWRGQR